MRSFLKKFRLYFVFAAIFSFSVNMLLLVPSLYMLQTYDRVLGSRSLETLYMLTLILAVALLVMGGLEMVRSRLLVKANNAMDAMLSPHLLHRMLANATAPEGNRYATGMQDINTIKTFLTGPSIFGLFDAPWMPVYLLILYMMSPLLFAIALGGSFLMLLLTGATSVLTKEPMKEASLAGRKASSYVASALRNAEVVNAMGMVGGVTRRWAAFNTRAVAMQTSASNRAGTVSGMTKFVRQFLQSLMLGAGAYLVITSTGFTSGMMIVGTIILGKALTPIESIIASWNVLFEAKGAYARLDEFLKAQMAEPPHMQLPPPTGKIQLEKVVFSLKQPEKAILKDVSFALEAGESLGIIGPSAAGKSSLARVLTGVWTPVAGAVRLDGADLATWSGEELGRYLGYLPQDVELFEGSIAENIARLGDAETDMVIAAARLAGVHDMILQMPSGYDTQIGTGGAVLSGGQRQRIGLARALFGMPRLVVLDEPNASLDADGEKALLAALQHLKQANCTTIVITHKVPLLAAVDKLLVMQGGAVAAFGPREEVLGQIMKLQQAAAAAAAQPAAAAFQVQLAAQNASMKVVSGRYQEAADV